MAATPDETYRALLDADIAATPPARALIGLSQIPERARALLRREPPPPPTARDARLRDVLADNTPWTVLEAEPGRGS